MFGSPSHNNGPGFIPSIINAPSMIAVVPEPGIPTVNNGTKAPTAAELFAVSGAAKPSMAPFPNLSGFFDNCFSYEELLVWGERNRKILEKTNIKEKPELVCELKIDGLKVVLV